MATTYLTDTQGTPTDNNTWTFSAWIKKSAIGSGEGWLFVAYSDSTNMTGLRMNGSGDTHSLNFWDYQSGDGGYTGRLVTNRAFRDCSGWMHVVVVWDSDNVTAGDRMKMYINGVEETSFSTDTNPSSGQSTVMNTSSQVLTIGANTAEGSYYDGLMSAVSFCDGSALAPTVFGQTDSATGEWTINTSPSFTLGTNGFKILENGNTITDQSSNSNDFALGGGTLTNTEDCPSDVFSTMNPLNVPTSNIPTFANGNTKVISYGGTSNFGGSSTLGMTKGKFYCEAKATVGNGAASYSRNTIGISGEVSTQAKSNVETGSNSVVYYGSETGNKYVNGTTSSYGATYATNDIIGIAVDLDSGTKTVTFYKNGSSQGAITIPTAVSSTTDGAFFIYQGDNSGVSDSTSEFDFNFGNGYFGTTAISSAGTNASGIGLFEYDVPADHTALSTKGLNE